jgi:hypothetical protein
MSPTPNSRVELSLASQTPQFHIFLEQPSSLVHFEPGVWSTSFPAPKHSNISRHGVLYYLPINAIHYTEKMFCFIPGNPIIRPRARRRRLLMQAERRAAGLFSRRTSSCPCPRSSYPRSSPARPRRRLVLRVTASGCPARHCQGLPLPPAMPCPPAVRRSLSRSSMAKIPEDLALNVACTLRYEINMGFGTLREIGQGHDLKKFLIVC